MVANKFDVGGGKSNVLFVVKEGKFVKEGTFSSIYRENDKAGNIWSCQTVNYLDE